MYELIDKVCTYHVGSDRYVGKIFKTERKQFMLFWIGKIQARVLSVVGLEGPG